MTAACVGPGRYAKKPRQFDSAQWKLAALQSPQWTLARLYDRCNMVDDLRKRGGLKGRTRAEVIALLGKPETHSGDPSDHYHLCPSFADEWILVIRWKNGRVASTHVRDT